MLAMAAFQFGHPVLLFVLMESNNSLIHERERGLTVLHQMPTTDNSNLPPMIQIKEVFMKKLLIAILSLFIVALTTAAASRCENREESV